MKKVLDTIKTISRINHCMKFIDDPLKSRFTVSKTRRFFNFNNRTKTLTNNKDQQYFSIWQG